MGDGYNGNELKMSELEMGRKEMSDLEEMRQIKVKCEVVEMSEMEERTQ